MTLVLGIDPSTKKIAVVGMETATQTMLVDSGGLFPKGVTKQTPESLGNAVRFMSDFLASVEDIAPPTQRVAYVELPIVGRGGSATTIKQAYVGGIIRGCLDKAGFRVYDAHPSTWRKELGITGKGTVEIKAATKRQVQARWPKVAPEVQHDGDLTDAAAICLYGVEVVRKATGIQRSAARATSRSVSKR